VAVSVSLRFTFLGVLSWAALSSSPAAASPKYSDRLEERFDMTCAPTCLLCHTNAQGGFATANTKFGVSLRKAGLSCCDLSDFDDLIDEVEEAETDSDDDGIPDLEELADGTDPNKKIETAELACAPEAATGGCSASGRAGAAGALTFVIGLTFAALARRRSRR
jgi:hypothetical protein